MKWLTTRAAADAGRASPQGRSLGTAVALAFRYADSRGLFTGPAPPVEKLRIALPGVPHAALLHIAAAKGYFADEGLDVTILPVSHGKAALDLLAQGKADLASTAEVPFVISVLKGERLGIAATVVSISNDMAVVARRDRAHRCAARPRWARGSASPSAPAGNTSCGPS